MLMLWGGGNRGGMGDGSNGEEEEEEKEEEKDKDKDNFTVAFKKSNLCQYASHIARFSHNYKHHNVDPLITS